MTKDNISMQKFGSTFLCTLWRGGEGGKKKRTICTLPKMSVIMNDPLGDGILNIFCFGELKKCVCIS